MPKLRGDELNKLKSRLLNLAIGEFAALCTFYVLYRLSNPGNACRIAFLYLLLILLQGSLYWFYRYVLIARKRSSGITAEKLLRLLRWINVIILAAVSAAMPIIKSSVTDLIVSAGILLFGIIEYINYYWYRLSYGKSGFNIKILIRTGLKKSSISKLISKQ